MRGRKLADDQIAAIRSMRSLGRSLTEIVAITGHAKSCVSRHCRGVRLPNGPLKRGPRNALSRAICRKLKAEGLSIRKIAARVGKSASAVQRALHLGA